MNRHQYLGYWIEVFVEPLPDEEEFGYTASVELPDHKGVVSGGLYSSYDEAVFAAEELINSWK